MRRSKVKRRARAQMAAQASTLTHGTPSLVRRRRSWGAWPSSAIAKGMRVTLIIRGLNMPTPLIMPPATTASARSGPARMRAASVHAPVENWPGARPARATAVRGTM